MNIRHGMPPATLLPEDSVHNALTAPHDRSVHPVLPPCREGFRMNISLRNRSCPLPDWLADSWQSIVPPVPMCPRCRPVRTIAEYHSPRHRNTQSLFRTPSVSYPRRWNRRFLKDKRLYSEPVPSLPPRPKHHHLLPLRVSSS